MDVKVLPTKPVPASLLTEASVCLLFVEQRNYIGILPLMAVEVQLHKQGTGDLNQSRYSHTYTLTCSHQHLKVNDVDLFKIKCLNDNKFLNLVWFSFKSNIIFGADAAITSTLRCKDIRQRSNKASLLPASDSWNDKKLLGFGHKWEESH